MSTARANFNSVISADATQFHATMRRVATTAKTVGSRIGKSMANATRAMGRVAASAGKAALAIGAVGGAIAAAALTSAVKEMYDLGGSLSDLSSRTGIAVSELSILQRAFQDNGIAADKVGPIVNKMQKGITDFGAGLSTQVRAFDRLGISYDMIRDKSPTEQFAMIQNALAGIDNQTVKAATAMEIFGKSGGELLTLFDDTGAIEKATSSMGSAAGILERNAQTFDRISDLMQSAGASLKLFALGVAEVAAPKILEALENFDQIDFAEKGIEFAAAINLDAIIGFFQNSVPKIIDSAKKISSAIIEALTSFYKTVSAIDFKGMFLSIAKETPEILGQGLIKAAKNLGNLLIAHVMGLGAALFQMLKESAKNFISLVQIVTKPEFWKGMGNLFISIALTFGAKLMEMASKVLRAFRDLPVIGEKAVAAADSLDASRGNVEKLAADKMEEGAADLAPSIDKIVSRMEASLKGVSKAYIDGFKKAGEIFDTTEQSDRIAAAMQRIIDATIKPQNPNEDALEKPAANTTRGADRVGAFADRIAKINELQSTGFRGLAELELMQLEKGAGIGPGKNNAFSRDRKRLGIGSGLSTGGLGAKRAVGGQKDEAATKRQIELAKSTDEHLMDIKERVGKALTVSQ